MLSFSFTIMSIWQNRTIVALTSLQVPTKILMGICMGASFLLSSLESSALLTVYQPLSKEKESHGCFFLLLGICDHSLSAPYPVFLLASAVIIRGSVSGLGLVIIQHSDNPHIFQPNSSTNTSFSRLQGNGVEQWKHVHLPFTM